MVVKQHFSVAVHCTLMEDPNRDGDKAQAIQKITDENELVERGYEIEDLSWLKRKDKALEHYASLGIWFGSAEVAW